MNMIISSRLTPAFRVGEATVSLWPTNRPDATGKPVWGWEVELPDGRKFDGEDLAGWGNAGEMARALASFLAACGEAIDYQDRRGREDEYAGLFPEPVGRWAAENTDELWSLSMDPEDKES